VAVKRKGEIPEELTSEKCRRQALTNLEQDMWASTTTKAMMARARTSTRMLAFWGKAPRPLNVDKILALGAGLKQGGYRSAATYLDLYKGMAERWGQAPDVIELRALKDAKRSCERGIGGATRALPLPFEQLSKLPQDNAAWPTEGASMPKERDRGGQLVSTTRNGAVKRKG
jgi:hypothetical protein